MAVLTDQSEDPLGKVEAEGKKINLEEEEKKDLIEIEKDSDEQPLSFSSQTKCNDFFPDSGRSDINQPEVPGLTQLVSAMSNCVNCSNILLSTCCRVCFQCQRSLCTICERTCLRNDKLICKKCNEENELIAKSSPKNKLICKGCLQEIEEEKKVCEKCQSLYCKKCSLCITTCNICSKRLCVLCTRCCTKCKRIFCIENCSKVCKGCNTPLCTGCAKFCEKCNWALHLEECSKKFAKLSSDSLEIKGIDPHSEDYFIVRGTIEFQTGKHSFYVSLEQVQRDCAGYGFGICKLEDYEKWFKLDNKDVSNMLIGITANNMGMSPLLTGEHALLKNGNAYSVLVDREMQVMRITGPGTNLEAKLDPTAVYIPVLTRCHGKFQIKVKPIFICCIVRVFQFFLRVVYLCGFWGLGFWGFGEEIDSCDALMAEPDRFVVFMADWIGVTDPGQAAPEGPMRGKINGREPPSPNS